MYALINNDKVVVQVQTKIAEGFIKVDDNVYCGMVYDGVKFNKPEPKIYVPQTITLRQAREIIIRNGLFNSVEAYINNIEDETERLIARNYWEYSEVFERNHPVLLTLVSALDITDEQLDEMFKEASKL